MDTQTETEVKWCYSRGNSMDLYFTEDINYLLKIPDNENGVFLYRLDGDFNYNYTGQRFATIADASYYLTKVG